MSSFAIQSFYDYTQITKKDTNFSKYYKVRVMQNVYTCHEKLEVFFLFFILKAYNMRWKNLNLFFDENAWFIFY